MARMNYSNRLTALKNRRQDPEQIAKAFSLGQILIESYEGLKEADSIRYVIGAMQPVDAKYTQNTYDEGERVKNHLKKLIDSGYNIDFRYQGSVTNNTHIKVHSDIDILTIHLGFISLEPPQIATIPYQGNPVKDLCKLREDSYSILRTAFPAAEIDNTGAKSISLKGGSLKRKVDVVPSNWYDTVKYTDTKLEYYRGVMVLDYEKKVLIPNTPFFHNKLLDDKDANTLRNYKKVVRLLKTLKADAEVNINLSSYDIASLMYHLKNSDYIIGNSPLLLIYKSLEFLKYLYGNESYRNSLKVPDGSRCVFQSNGATQNDLKLMIIELNNTYQDLLDDLIKSGSNINKQIIA